MKTGIYTLDIELDSIYIARPKFIQNENIHSSHDADREDVAPPVLFTDVL